MNNESPTAEQLQAIAEFARKHGPAWKVALSYAWINGDDVRCQDGHLLRQVRNQFGPKWLRTFKLEGQ